MKHSQQFDVIVALFMCVVLISNLLSSAKIIDVGLAVGEWRLVFDAGTLVFPISYIFGDILTEIYGYRRTRLVIWLGFAGNALMAFFVWLAGVLPGEVSWEQYAGNTAYNAILGGISGLAVASLLAYLAGSFSNSYVLARLKVMTDGKMLPLRTIGSTVVGQGIDTLVFFLIAGLFGVFPWPLIPALIATNYVLKVGIEVICTPLTLPVLRFLKHKEGTEAFDTEVNFNPFTLRG